MRTIIAESMDKSVRVVFHSTVGSDFRNVVVAAARLTREGFECSSVEMGVTWEMWVH